MDRKKITLLIGLLLFVGLIVGGTFAYWTWNSTENKSIVFNTVGNVSEYIVYDEGSSYFLGDFKPTDSYCQSVNTTISLKKTAEAETKGIAFRATINMDVNAIGPNIANSSDVYWVVTQGDNNITCSGGLSDSIVLGSGTFFGKVVDETFKLVSDLEVTTTEEEYTIWIWINSNGTDLSKLSGETVDTNIWTQIDMVDPDEDNDIENNKDIYTITYNVNGGTNGPTNQEKPAGESVILSSTVPTRTGYTFSGWNTIPNGTGTNYSAGATYNTDADLVLYAVWTPNTYTINYNAGGGSGSTSSTSCSYGKSCTLRNNGFTKTGYTFSGWTDTESGTDVVYKNGATILLYDKTSNMTLYALWEANTYTISYDANYGTGEPSDQTKTYGETLTLSTAVPTREKYAFVEWNTNADGTGTSYQPGDSYSTEQVLTLYAIWEMANDYVINLDANGGVISSTNYTTVGESTYTVPEDGTYKIELWGAQGGSYDATYYGGYGGYTSGNILLNANEYVYVYVGGQNNSYNGGGVGIGNGKSGGGATDVRLNSGNWDTAVGLNSRIMVAGGGGAGGYLNSDNGGAGGAGGGLSGSYGAVNIVNSFYLGLRYSDNGGSQTAGGYISSPDRTGQINGNFGIGGTWSADSNGISGGGGGYYGGGPAVNSSSGSGGSSYISGHTGCVAITSDSSATPKSGCTTGSTDNTCSVHYSGKVFTDTLMIDGNGYKWTTSKGNLEQMPNPNGGYYASGNGHTGNGAARISKLNSFKTVTYGATYGTLSSPTREGYTFLGWYTAESGGTKVTNDTVVSVSNNHTLYAQWELDGYTISYNANGGSGAPASQIKTHNVALTLSSTVPTLTGHTFQSWNTKVDGSGSIYSAGGSYTANESATLYAQWNPDTYQVCFNANGGSGAPGCQTKTYGVTLTLSSTKPTRNGYNFLGWSTSSGATSATYASGASYTTNAGATLYAVWSAASSQTITLSGETFYTGGSSNGGNAWVGNDSVCTEAYNYVVRYNFTTPSSGVRTISSSFTTQGATSGTITSSNFYWYVTTSSSSHLNARTKSYAKTGILSYSSSTKKFTGANTSVSLAGNTTYYLYVWNACDVGIAWAKWYYNGGSSNAHVIVNG